MVCYRSYWVPVDDQLLQLLCTVAGDGQLLYSC
jgi:hypothetical protein